MVLKKASRKPGKGLQILPLIARSVRLEIIMILGTMELPSGAIAAQLDYPLPRISEHLTTLHRAGIVKRRKAGRQHFYRLADPDFQQLSALLADIVTDD